MEQNVKNLLGEYAFLICSLQAQIDALKQKETNDSSRTEPTSVE